MEMQIRMDKELGLFGFLWKLLVSAEMQHPTRTVVISRYFFIIPSWHTGLDERPGVEEQRG